MSRRNGNRSRFDRQRKSKMHYRTRIRELKAALKPQVTDVKEKAESTAS